MLDERMDVVKPLEIKLAPHDDGTIICVRTRRGNAPSATCIFTTPDGTYDDQFKNYISNRREIVNTILQP
jgi:hypothetical protein